MYICTYMQIMHIYKRCDIFPKPSALREGRLHPCSYDFERNEITARGDWTTRTVV